MDKTDKINEVQDMLELRSIGGKERYAIFCNEIDTYLLNNPNAKQNEYDIAKATKIPLVAIRRAIREGKIGYNKNKVELPTPKTLDDAAKKFREANKVDIVRALDQKAKEDRRIRNEKLQIKGFYKPSAHRTSAKPIVAVDAIMKRSTDKRKLILDNRDER